MKAAPMTETSFEHKDLTGIGKLSADDINIILDRAQYFADALEKNAALPQTLNGKVIFNLFFENSTRTRLSFEMAAHRLGANIINWDTASSSVSKGETFDDTIKTLNAMRPDGIIIRHSDFGAPEYVGNNVDCPVVNAGDSYREHPTQALLDALTIKQIKGRIEGLTIAICGDVAHSRVANSNIILLKKLGAHVRVIAPPFLMPQKFPAADIETFESLESGLPDCDIVMMLRNQKERMEAGLIKDDTEFFNQFGLTTERLTLAKPDAYVMHPGPMNRNVEIADGVADDPHKSLITRQVANGIPTRMAVLELLMGA
jgi:aspartate carbamoyltransferase catalytic subunit